MTTNSTVLISNPNAGRGGQHRKLEVRRFREKMESLNVGIDLLNTTLPDEATTQVKAAIENGATTIVVSGGDGTINEALQGLIGTQTRLAIWPRGTANVLARELGIPTDLEKVAEIIARGNTKKIYPGCAINEESDARRYFFLMAGIGLDASVVKGVNAGLKRRIGKAAFWYSGLEHLAGWVPVPFTVEAGGTAYTATFAAIGKGSLYGGGLSVTPRANLENPEFEICVMSAKTRLSYLRVLPAIMRGGISNGTKDVTFIRTTRARVIGDVAVQVDGELIGAPPMSFEVVAEPLSVVVP